MTLTTHKYKRLWGFLRPYWHLEVITFLVMIVISALILALPLAVQYMIDVLIPSLIASSKGTIDFKPVINFGLFLVGIYFLNVLFSWLRDYLAGKIGANIIADIRLMLFERLENSSLRFFQTHEVGEIMSRLLNDVARIQNLLTSTLLMFLTNILMLAVMLIYLFSVNWLLTLVALVPVPMTIILSRRFGRLLNQITRRLQETIAKFSARLQEAFLFIRTTKAFNQEQREVKKARSLLQELTGLYIKNSVTSSLAMNFVYFVNMLGPVVVLSWGTYLVASGAFKLGELIAFYLLLTYLYSPIRDLASVNIEVQSAMASVDRIFEYLDLPPAVVEVPNTTIPSHIEGEITLDNVFFRYKDNSFGIRNLSLHIAPRENIAIVGPSGSGKTTLVNLIMRFFDPQSGTISLDGHDLRQLSLKFLRECIGLVDQDPMLFKASLRENIAYSKPDATMEEITQAARIANIHDFIEQLPQKYDSEVGERGVTLSGGEKQRICLARAVLKDPRILILDEATSALDSNSEQLIQESLKKILTDKTAIIIAHRFSTIQHAHRIIVLDTGTITAQGSHQELMETSPLYRDLAQKQLRE